MKSAQQVDLLRRKEAEAGLKARRARDEAKKGELTITELETLDNNTSVFMSMGKAFVASKASSAVSAIKEDVENQARQSKMFGSQYEQTKKRREAEEKDMNDQFRALRRLQGR